MSTFTLDSTWKTQLVLEVTRLVTMYMVYCFDNELPVEFMDKEFYCNAIYAVARSDSSFFLYLWTL